MSEKIKTVGEARVEKITDLLNQIILEGVIPAEWTVDIIVKCHKGKAFLRKRKL